ncbi:MAG TPA: HAD-IA family hydrolase [Candidatus Saccharimonadales bacterium]|nr:HAD-IA family hydrolase [Candidatus Saccharimonadales bacterium]
MIRAVIFDCFGVVISDALSVMTGELYQAHPEAEAQVHRWLDQANKNEISSEELSTRMSALFGLSFDEYRAQLFQHEVKDQVLLDYIADLRSHHKTALLSNIPKGSLQRRFSSEELARYFDAVVASGEVGYAKPEAEVYEITADRLGVRLDECVFTDDREPYCEGARRIGMQAILYQDFSQFQRELEVLLANA